MARSTPTALQDLGPLVFCKHALHLQQSDTPGEAGGLMNWAIELDPHYGHACNEMAYVQGKAGYLDAAKEAALNAIDCDPGDAKFVNTLVGIEIDRAKRTTTAEERRAHGEKLLQVIEAKLHQNPEYPGLWLSKAEALAMAGRPTAEWAEALSGAEKCYRIRGTTAGGVKISDLNA